MRAADDPPCRGVEISLRGPNRLVQRGRKSHACKILPRAAVKTSFPSPFLPANTLPNPLFSLFCSHGCFPLSQCFPSDSKAPHILVKASLSSKNFFSSPSILSIYKASRLLDAPPLLSKLLLLCKASPLFPFVYKTSYWHFPSLSQPPTPPSSSASSSLEDHPFLLPCSQ